MESFSFDGVQAAEGISMTMPGTVGLFNIGKVEFGASKEKQTTYMKLTFQSKKVRNEQGQLIDEESSFNHSFYMTPGALKRAQYLAKVMFDQEFTGTLTETQLTQAFLNKDVALKVSGQVSDKGKGYPELSFAGFAMKASEFLQDPGKLTFNSTERSAVVEALQAIKDSRSSNADSEGASGAIAPAAVSGAAKKAF